MNSSASIHQAHGNPSDCHAEMIGGEFGVACHRSQRPVALVQVQKGCRIELPFQAKKAAGEFLRQFGHPVQAGYVLGQGILARRAEAYVLKLVVQGVLDLVRFTLDLGHLLLQILHSLLVGCEQGLRQQWDQFHRLMHLLGVFMQVLDKEKRSGDHFQCIHGKLL